MHPATAVPVTHDTVSQVVESPFHPASLLTRREVEAGLTNGTFVPGITMHRVRGSCVVPARGGLLRPWVEESIHPQVRGRTGVGWLVAGEASAATAARIPWVAPVVGVAKRG